MGTPSSLAPVCPWGFLGGLEENERIEPQVQQRVAPQTLAEKVRGEQPEAIRI